MHKQSTGKQQSTKQQQSTKPYCKVCFDAGKSTAEYTSHYVRDRPGGVVVCPTLLTQCCKYCKKPGHTPSQCPELEGKYQKRPNGVVQPQQAKVQANGVVQAKAQANGVVQAKAQVQPLRTRAARLCESPPPRDEAVFSALNENYPIIGQKNGGGRIIRTNAPNKLDRWATIAAQPAKKAQEQAKKEQEQTPECEVEVEAAKECEVEANEVVAQAPAAQAPSTNANAVAAQAPYVVVAHKSWADYDD
jgi:hypothetical protein